ncbi:DUF1311 domain-containing protein [Xenorhabdus sp. 12]|uniref:DUF1311 domain-containing protein n=1 Tax=Xenorhabdus santafensis TaxID=2582833 RepID=A0ABU4S9B8_9GAMM|nr:DUF1311 domain-containing protein [Xenorhabdus sp. 12]
MKEFLTVKFNLSLLSVTSIILCLPFSSIANTHADKDVIADPLTQCYNQIGDAPRTAIQGCLTSKLTAADSAMTKAVRDNKTNLEQTGSSATKTAIASLKKSQKDFLRFRESECQRQSDAILGGSGSGDVFLSCKVELTYSRVKSLQKE